MYHGGSAMAHWNLAEKSENLNKSDSVTLEYPAAIRCLTMCGFLSNRCALIPESVRYLYSVGAPSTATCSASEALIYFSKSSNVLSVKRQSKSTGCGSGRPSDEVGLVGRM